MVTFRNYLKADLYKFSHSKIIISHLIIPVIGIILMIAYFAISSLGELEKISAYMQIISIAFPLIISMVITMVYEQEEEAKGFQYFLSTASKRYVPHTSKLVLLIIFGMVSTLISIVGFGIIFNILSEQNISVIFYIKEAVIIFISNLPIYVIQYLVAFSFGKGAAMGLGVIGTLITALMLTGLGDGIWFILPWGYSIRLSSYFFQYEMMNNCNLAVQSEVNIAIISIILFIITGIVSLIVFSNCWEGKKESY